MLEVTKLNVSYGDAQALWDIDLTVEKGEICTLVGANGGGKTTFLKAVCGLLPVQSGSISLLGQNLAEIEAHDRVGMGLSMIPEGRRIFANMTVEENLLVGAYLPKCWQRREELLEKNYELFPRLRERKKQSAGTLSGGERQMLAIGRALASDPAILLLDEPSLGLAPKVVGQVMDLIRSVNEAGVTILLVEQNAHIALKLAHRGYVIENGRITMSDRAEVLAADDHVRTAYLGL